MIPPNTTLIHVWEWFILFMVMYNMFSAPYIISFVESDVNVCGDSSPIAPILTMLSQACQANDSYEDVAAAHPTGIEEALDGTPVQYAVYLPCSSSLFTVFNYLSDIAFFVDIVLNFLTGYIPRRSSVPEHNLKRIAVNYIRDTFVFDAVATFPWEMVLKWWFPSIKDWLGLKMINLVRFIRLIKVQRKLGDYLISPFVHFGCLIGVYLLCAHFLGCGLFYVGRWQLWGVDGVSANDFLGDPWVVKECIQFADSSTQYSVSLYWSVTTITTVGYGDIAPNTNTDKMVVMMAMFCSGVLQAAILANVALIVDGIQGKRAHVTERVKQVTAALTFHDIPATLIQRVVDSIEYYASQHYGSHDREIMEVFPERLRTDIANAVLGEVYPAIGIFLGCSRSMSRQLAMRWTMMIAPPNEPVLVTGAPVVELYHLVQGVCVARTSSGIHIDTLAEGSALGHLDAVLGTPCGADILAKTYCTMYCLSVTELLEVFESFPEEANRIRARAKEERSRSRNTTVAKLLQARTAARPNMSRSVLPASVMQALADEPDTSSEGGHHEPHSQDHGSPDLQDHGSEIRDTSIPNGDMVILEPSELEDGNHETGDEPFKLDHPQEDTVWHARSASGGYRSPTQRAVLSQARQKAQGMILSLQDTLSTLGALTGMPATDESPHTTTS